MGAVCGVGAVKGVVKAVVGGYRTIVISTNNVKCYTLRENGLVLDSVRPDGSERGIETLSSSLAL